MAGEGGGREEEMIERRREMVETMERGRLHLQSIKTGDLWKKEKSANFFFHSFFIKYLISHLLSIVMPYLRLVESDG